jgi:hypothetical protein
LIYSYVLLHSRDIPVPNGALLLCTKWKLEKKIGRRRPTEVIREEGDEGRE